MESTGHPPGAYRFGPFRIDLGERLLRQGDSVLPLTPKAVDTLVALVQNRSRLVSKDELMTRLWPGTFVEEANLTNQISLLRKALGDNAAEPTYIETVPRRGYRFVADVTDGGVPEAPGTAQDIVVNGGAAARSRSRRTATVAALACVLLAAVIAATWWQLRGDIAPAGAPLKISRLTTSGQVRHAVASPDGKYVASPAHLSQFSTFSAGTRLNSATLSVTQTASMARACAAINMSCAPIGVPLFSRATRIEA